MAGDIRVSKAAREREQDVSRVLLGFLFYRMFSGADLTYLFTSADQTTAPETPVAAQTAPNT
jgi:hypothetical protein